MVNRYLDGDRPTSTGGSLASAWMACLPAYRAAVEGCLLHTALAELWGFVGAGNRFVDAEKPWELAKAAKAGDAVAEERLRGVLGDLVRRAGSSAWLPPRSCRRPPRASSPSSAIRTRMPPTARRSVDPRRAALGAYRRTRSADRPGAAVSPARCRFGYS